MATQPVPKLLSRILFRAVALVFSNTDPEKDLQTLPDEAAAAAGGGGVVGQWTWSPRGP